MPVSVGLITGGAQVLGGLAQSIFSGKRKAEKDLENYANSYTPNSSILDYYNKALARYSSNPYTSQYFQNQTNQIGRNLATGIGAAQDRHSGLASIGGLVQGADDATAKAGATAENLQGQALGQLGQASKLKAGEDEKKYDLLYNLKSLKAGAANQQESAGLSNAFQGVGNTLNYLTAAKQYGSSNYGMLGGTNPRRP
jgi:hypothetical protein